MPAREIALLRQVLESHCHLGIDGDGTCTIKEDNPHAPLKRVKIRHLGTHAFAFSPEAGQRPPRSRGPAKYSPLLSSTGDHNKACDAVIYCTVQNTHYLLLCELKSQSVSGHQEQFMATRCFLEYLHEVLRRLCDCTPIQRKVRHIVFNLKKTILNTLEKHPVRPHAVSRDDMVLLHQVHDGDTVGVGVLVS